MQKRIHPALADFLQQPPFPETVDVIWICLIVNMNEIVPTYLYTEISI